MSLTVLIEQFQGIMHSMKEELKLMKSGSAIVNAASVAGVRGVDRTAAYCASKHGVLGLTRACAKDYGPRGVRINGVAPGYIDTPKSQGTFVGPEADAQKIANSMPIARTTTPQEVANVVCFLLSDQASYVTGSIYGVDGGWDA